MTVEAATGVLNRLSHWKLFSLALLLGGVGYETKAGPPGDPELFRFTDGGAFDFRTERDCSIGGRTQSLANSNQRGRKGLVTTFEVTRTIGPAGRLKLDGFL